MKKRFTLIMDSAPLPSGKHYPNVFKPIVATILLVIALAAGCKKDDFKGEIKGNCPVVVSTDPADKAVDVVLEKAISVTFNTNMSVGTVNANTFTIKQGATAVAGKITASADAKTFTFTPTVPLLPFAIYTGTITTGATDTLRTALVSNFVWSFTTIPQLTLTANPTIGGTATGEGVFARDTVATATATPSAGYAFVNWTENGTIVSTSSSYQFTLSANRALVANFKVIPPSQFAVALSSLPVKGGTTSGSGAYNAGTKVTVTASPSAKYTFINWTENGNIVSASSSYQFILAGNRKLIANFKAIPASQFALTITSNPAEGGSTTGSGAYNAGATATIQATANAGYNFTSWSGDASGSTNPLNVTMSANKNITANFTLIVVVPPPNLGSIDIFGAFGGNAGVTNQGLNTIINNGSIGTTAASTLITGFHDGTTADVYTETPLNKGDVTGRIYTAPPAPGNATSFAIASQALIDATIAYNSISPASKPGGTDPGAGELGGLTLAAGVYKSASGTFKITNGDLTLDAKGDPNAVFIFQTAAGLTVGTAGPAGARNVKLKGGAQAKNVFWYVGSAAVINGAGGGIMTGTIIATAGVTFSTAGNAVQTVLNGRAISLVASVTMVNTTINVPQ
ncbi:ice-binding family protein [Mucilaginibacter flavidus]|uniref:ice-binding family protein n=1 Tax=Mucilaginibacter flavidus TaxID=2949309 RepID=UPI002093CE2D|nr:ice-binding family protein [Mucilaginibacter flavidus]MCO5947193.1 ice-binding family protein [Mucilaginibacter flavidus]